MLAAVFLWEKPAFVPATSHLLLALGITIAFSLVAWRARGVNLSGALAGTVIAFILAARDIRLLGLLVVVFAITLGATRWGADRKRQMRAAERPDGRSASQVISNVGVAGLAAALASLGRPAFVLALAAMAEAAADTASSEVGMAFPGQTVLITTGRPVPAGMDGGISLRGTAAALAAAAVVALAGRAVGLVPFREAVVIACSGFLGALIDSLLGAVLERRGWLDNDLVNLLSTAAAAAMAWLMA